MLPAVVYFYLIQMGLKAAVESLGMKMAFGAAKHREAEYRVISDRRALLLQADSVHEFLTASYWAEGIPKRTVKRSMRNSLCFGVLHGKKLVAFSRVITDKATYAYLADVFVLEEHRGNGLSKRMMEAVKAHKDLQGIRRFMLVTRDAHDLYSQYGFKPVAQPERHMERVNREIYKKQK